MAKVSFTKLGLTKNQDVKTVSWNEQSIEVKQYLPVTDKLTLISNVLNNAHDENNFSNPVKLKVFSALEIMYAYTNINFTDKQKEDAPKLYDLITGSGLFNEIVNNIPLDEYNGVMDGVFESVDAIYTYRNSAMGILETITADYSNLSLNANAITDTLLSPENLQTLKELSALA